MDKLRLLDLFCGAGGATKGYQRAGFYVVGVDIKPQPRYCGDEFHQGDAFEFLSAYYFLLARSGFDAVHASPPCQRWTRARKLRGRQHPDYITPVRERLLALDLPWVIENVPGAPLRNPTLLCGLMFDLDVYRHRLFETSFPVALTLHPSHHAPNVKMGRPVKDGDMVQPVGNFSGVAVARRAMGTPWMTQQDMREAIPPAYTEWIGARLLETLLVGSPAQEGKP